MEDYTTHRFLKLLKKEGIKYHYEDKWLVLDGDIMGNVFLYNNKLSSNINPYNTILPNNIKFNNKGTVNLNDNLLTSLPKNIKFNNGGYVDLSDNKIKSLPDNIQFNNNSWIDLSNNKLTSLPKNIKFNNSLDIDLSYNYLDSLPDTIDLFYDRLDSWTKRDIKEKFSDHWFFDKERFGL